MKPKLLPLSLMAMAIVGISPPATAEPSKYYGAHLCGYSGFKCIKVHKGDTWAKMFPDRRDREIVKRLNRMNVELRYREWIIVPTNIQTINHMDLSPFPTKIAATGKRTVIVKLNLFAFGAYDVNGNLVHWGPVSGGRGWCEDVGRECSTATGSYTVYRKQGADCVSSIFPVDTNGGAPMPYCMHYHGGYALHGSTLPGFHGSHGCIRLFNDDAKWLNTRFIQIGSRVIVSW